MMNFNADSAAFEQMSFFDFEAERVKVDLVEHKIDQSLNLPTLIPVRMIVEDLTKRMDLVARQPEKVRFLVRDAMTHVLMGTRFSRRQHRFLFQVYRDLITKGLC
jgi:hypothetical protein